MQTIALSDLHGFLPNNIPEFDLLIIAGDTNPVWNHNIDYSRKWYLENFAEWINHLKFKDEFSKVILVAGNHDWLLARDKSIIQKLEAATNYNLKYLQDEEYNFVNTEVDWRIYGTPWCQIFGNWAFMVNDHKLALKYSSIPEGLDILVGHDMPFNTADKVFFTGDKNEGNKVLAEAITNKKPRIYIGGHLHDPENQKLSPAKLGETLVYNVASVDEEYNLKQNYYTLI